MAQLLTKSLEAPAEVEHTCANCRGRFIGTGYRSRGSVYCCDVCARRASRPGFATSLAAATSLVALGYILGGKR